MFFLSKINCHSILLIPLCFLYYFIKLLILFYCSFFGIVLVTIVLDMGYKGTKKQQNTATELSKWQKMTKPQQEWTKVRIYF